MAPHSVSILSTLLPQRIPFYYGNRLPPEDVLPIELWDTIFDELTTRELLDVATVCALFNVLCIRTFLRRNKSSDSIFSASDLVVSSPKCHILVAFQLCIGAPALERFSCTLGPSMLRTDLGLLRSLVAKSKHLRELRLDLHQDLFYVPTYRSASSHQTLLATFCAVISAMVTRIPGPVVIFSGQDIFSSRPEDVASWNLHLFQFNCDPAPRGLYSHLRDVFKPKDAKALLNETLKTNVRLHTGDIVAVKALTRLQSISLQSISSDAGGMPPFTILTFDVTRITRLSFGTGMLPADNLSAAIIHVRLPFIQRLTVSTDEITSTALGHFLLHHPSLEQLKYVGNRDGNTLHPDPLLQPPLTHPGLMEIDTTALGTASARTIITELSASPNLRKFSFSLSSCPSAENAASLIADLREIGRRSAENDTHLTFTLWDPSAGDIWDPADDENEPEVTHFFLAANLALDAAKSLHCVRNVAISCWSVRTAMRTLPWLSLLPGIPELQFCLFLRTYDGPSALLESALRSEVAAFLREARSAMPGVSISARLC
ncbi:hypothetical protein C8R43DRAFT_1045289 [Mycena crocata]|nr:hypothetical protein C8R43DRAFT_1045289 [Mycena crocata]